MSENENPKRIWKYYDGCVKLENYMGGDLAVVNAARVSFNKYVSELKEADIKLIKYLADNKHMSPFRHVQVTLVLQGIPEFILRQLYKHQVGIAYTSGEFREAATVWNEVSGRYVEFDIDFFEPATFREQDPNNRQASKRDLPIRNEDEVRRIYKNCIRIMWDTYQELLSIGVCREQARLVLPLSFKTSVVWTASLEALVHFIKLRDHDGAQVEIQELAKIVHEIVSDLAPVSVKALLGQ